MEQLSLAAATRRRYSKPRPPPMNRVVVQPAMQAHTQDHEPSSKREIAYSLHVYYKNFFC